MLAWLPDDPCWTVLTLDDCRKRERERVGERESEAGLDIKETNDDKHSVRLDSAGIPRFLFSTCSRPNATWLTCRGPRVVDP